MKTSKSPKSGEVSPSLKKLKQARLPFKLISEVPSSPVSSQTRKRKLSAPDAVSATKIGKVCKENDSVEDLVVISDEDSKDDQIPPKEDKPLNPFVKLVDTAWKKKMQKAKSSKKNAKKGTLLDVTIDPVTTENANDILENKEVEQCEMMEVDIASESEVNIYISIDSSHKEVTENVTELSTVKIITRERISDIVVLEDSNNSPDEPIGSKANLEPNVEASKDSAKVAPDKSNEDQTADDSPIKEENIQINQITPKRSARNKAKAEQNNNSKSPSSSKLNESSNPTTPKQTRSSATSQDESLNESATSINLTPKQLQKKNESAKKRDEREKEKQEREKKKQQEREEKAKQRQEKEDQRKKEREEKEEAKKREKEEKEEQKKKEKEEKERQKELDKKLREEKEDQKRKEREEKEEQKRKEKEAKDEEKRKKQEALELEKQEQELKKKKAAEAFVNFFVPKQKSEKDQATLGPVSKNSMLSSFTIKVDMRLAPTIRVNLSEEKLQELEKTLQDQNVSESDLYLKCLAKGNTHKPLTMGKTWPMSDKDDDDVMIVEDELPPTDGAGELILCDSAAREKLRPKLLSFHENRRPPYWGTWRKKSASVKPRKPFGQDEKQVDYEADSDEEWEEEQEGESIDGSAAGSDDEQDADEYEVDNEVFVPHGYLSDEEATMDEDDVLSLSPETQKARLKHLEDEFESEMKKPTEKLKPRLYGLLWETKDGGKPEKCVDAIWNYFGKLAMIINDPIQLLQPTTEQEETEKKKVKKKKTGNDGEQKSPKSDKKKKSKSEVKDIKIKIDTKKNVLDGKNNQPVINMFLTKFKSN